MTSFKLMALVGAAVVLTGMSARSARQAPLPTMSRAEARQRAGALAALGRQMFRDRSLSASGRLSCATCHDPARAFGPPNADATQLGGRSMDREGTRAVPSLRYLQTVPAFTAHFHEAEDEGDESIDAGPTGGLMWDGRVDRGRDQALLPLHSPLEMAGDASHAASAASRAAYAPQIRALFSEGVFGNPPRMLAAIAEAIEAYEQTPAEFYPYSSKYDASLAGRAQLSPQERRGLALFEDPARGNCASCHVSRPDREGSPPQFTDYGLVAIGVPRNRTLRANADPGYFDLGACGPLRTDLRQFPEDCGRFMTPTLRNAATRHTFFHNGVVHTLRDAVTFYAERDTRPERWYPRDRDGHVEKFDDLPARYRGNVEMAAPFGQRAGDRPVLTDRDIDDIVAFIRTLTDRDVRGAAD